jgi:hypothetical protein
MGATAHRRHVVEAAVIGVARVFATFIRAMAGRTRGEVVHVHEIELRLGRIERDPAGRFVYAGGRLAALMAVVRR